MEVLRKQFLFSIAHTPQMLWPELKKNGKKINGKRNVHLTQSLKFGAFLSSNNPLFSSENKTLTTSIQIIVVHFFSFCLCISTEIDFVYFFLSLFTYIHVRITSFCSLLLTHIMSRTILQHVECKSNGAHRKYRT